MKKRSIIILTIQVILTLSFFLFAIIQKVENQKQRLAAEEVTRRAIEERKRSEGLKEELLRIQKELEHCRQGRMKNP